MILGIFFDEVFFYINGFILTFDNLGFVDDLPKITG